MNTLLRSILVVLISVLTLSACQTHDFSNQKAQTINLPIILINLDSDGDGVPDDLDQCPNTTENVVVDERGCPEITSLIGMPPMMEYRAFFTKDSSELLPQYHDELDRVAEQMNNYDTATMKIEAHVSKDEVNKASTSMLQSNSLAKNRALIVKNYLVLNHKIESSRLTTLDCGIKGSIAPSDTEEGRSMNRRVYSLVTDLKNYKANYHQNDLGSNRCIEF
ncbi:OmpA family protein [Psychrobacter sp. NC44]|uniref:OmpA family protein n=1 Tax=Psychrobacter sp. NC44 TaxID=2774130 RepID=UPI00191B49DD|nr:OmpA family protein [Psychrobacter sp. NC44]